MKNTQYFSKTFCPIPWNSLMFVNNGNFRVCCNADHFTRNGTILTNEDGHKYAAEIDDWNDVRNAPLLKDVRKTILQGNWHKECTRCRLEEESGSSSKRIMELNNYSNYFGNIFDFDKAIEVTAEDGSIDTDTCNINFLDIRFGNFCNLACRMCGPHDSHTWYDDYIKLNGKKEFEHLNWYENKTYYDNFKKYGVNATNINWVGGEPMLIKEHVDLLKFIVEEGTAKDMLLSYNSNMTSISTEIFELWKNFKEVRIAGSIDGYNEVFEYQRYPAKFKKVKQFMDKCDTHPSINFRLWLYCTVTILNVFHIPKFMLWKLKQNFKHWNKFNSPKPIISISFCHSPKHYSITSLPKEYKLELETCYNEYITEINKSNFDNKIKDNFEKILYQILNFANCMDSSDHIDTFVNVTKKLDNIRGQNILAVCPNYKDLFT